MGGPGTISQWSGTIVPSKNPWYNNSNNGGGIGTQSITDGTSNTLAFGESLGRSTSVKPADFIWSWMGGICIPTKFGIAGGGGTSAVVPLSMSSNHTGVINVAYADGSIRTLRPGASGTRNPTSIGSDWYVLQALAGMADGDVVKTEQLGN